MNPLRSLPHVHADVEQQRDPQPPQQAQHQTARPKLIAVWLDMTRYESDHLEFLFLKIFTKFFNNKIEKFSCRQSEGVDGQKIYLRDSRETCLSCKRVLYAFNLIRSAHYPHKTPASVEDRKCLCWRQKRKCLWFFFFLFLK